MKKNLLQPLWRQCCKMKNVFEFSRIKVKYTKPQSVYFFTPIKYTKPQSVYFFYSLKYTKPQSVYFISKKYTECHCISMWICADARYYDKCTYIQSVYYTLISVNSKIKIKKSSVLKTFYTILLLELLKWGNESK